MAGPAEEAGAHCPEGLWPLPPQVGALEGPGREGCERLAQSRSVLSAPSTVTIWGPLPVPPSSVANSPSQPGAWGLPSPPHHTHTRSPPAALSSVLSPCIGVTKSDLHTSEPRTGEYKQGPTLGVHAWRQELLAGFPTFSADGPHSLPLPSGRGRALVLHPTSKPRTDQPQDRWLKDSEP